MRVSGVRPVAIAPIGVNLVREAVDMHLRRVCVQGARASKYVEVHVVCLKQELCVGRSSLRGRRHREAEDQQYLCTAEKLRPQGAPFSIDSMCKAIVAVFKEGHDEFPTRGFAVSGLVRIACEGLVLRDVE